MKLTVKTLKGTHFPVTVQPNDTIMAVKKNIEEVQGKDSYPSGQQLLIHSGKVLKDESTLTENNITEEGFLVIMLSKNKPSGSSGSTSSQAVSNAAPASNVTSVSSGSMSSQAVPNAAPASDVASVTNQPSVPVISGADSFSALEDNIPAIMASQEQTVLQLLELGGGSWDREAVILALNYANHNPDLAADYLYTGIPDNTEVDDPSDEPDLDPVPASIAAHAAPASGAPNSSPLNLFPQEAVSGAAGAGAGSLEFLRNSPQFETLRSLVQDNPQILQPLLQELGKQNPNLIRLIQENNQEFLQLLNEPVDGSEGDIFEQGEDMPHAVNVTPAEQEALERMEAMGFDHDLVLEAFLACDRNEELAVNYLLENAGDFMD